MPAAVALQRLKPITGRCSKTIQSAGGLEKGDLLLQRGEHPLHISRRLVRDLLNGTEACVRFFVLIVRNPGADLDAIPAVRERNIGQVSTRKTALQRAFSAKNSGILDQLYIV